MTQPHDLSITILKQIRDELITTRTDLGARLDSVRTDLGARIDSVRTDLGARIDHVETTLVELAEQQRFVVRHARTLATHDRRIEGEVDELRSRVDALEERLPPR